MAKKPGTLFLLYTLSTQVPGCPPLGTISLGQAVGRGAHLSKESSYLVKWYILEEGKPSFD